MNKILILTIFVVLLTSCKELFKKSEKKNYFLIENQISVQPNDWVLAPSKAYYDSAVVNGLENSIFVFYPRKVIQPLDYEIKLNDIGDSVNIPKSLVISFDKNKPVSKGATVLTWWQNGTGMQRAIVLNKDTSLNPTVYYIDNQYSLYSSPTNIKYWMDTLMSNSFLVLKDSIMPGRSFSIQEEYFSTFYMVISVGTDSLVGLSWAGTLNVFGKNECKFVPIRNDFKVGDSVSVPYLGTYCDGRVKAVWSDIGKLTVRINFIGDTVTTYANMFDTFIY